MNSSSARTPRSLRLPLIFSLALLLGLGTTHAQTPAFAAPNSTSGEPSLTLDRTKGKLKVAFSISASGLVSVKALDAQEQPITTLIEETLDAGTHEFDFFSQELGPGSGAITVRITSGTEEFTRVIQP
jgi:hypothetical protein